MMLILAYDAYFFKKAQKDSGTKHHDAYKNMSVAFA